MLTMSDENRAGAYATYDFTNANFSSLWGSMPTSDGTPGRDDLKNISQSLGANAVRCVSLQIRG